MATNITTALKTAIDKIIKINTNKMSVDTFKKVFCTAHEVTYTITAGSGWTVTAHGAYLIGNCLRLNFTATRSTATGTGNITNETVCTFKISDPRITHIKTQGGRGSSTGPLVSLGANAPDTAGTINMVLNHTGTALTSTSYVDVIPVTIDITKF